MRTLLAAFLVSATLAVAQKPCAEALAYTPCDIAFELDAATAAAHPNPYLTVDLWAEFKSPEFKTYRVPAVWDGGRRMVFRINPVLAGEWTYRLSGNIPALDGKIDKFNAAPSGEATAFIRRANVHHWQYTEGRKPHLYMGADYQPGTPVDAYAAAKFSHLSIHLLPGAAFANAGTPNAAFYQQLDQQAAAMHAKGITVDLILAATPDELRKAFPTWQQRQRFLRFVVGRYAAFNANWQLVDVWETSGDARALLKEIGLEIKKLDPYGHPRSTRSRDTSPALGPDGWMDYVVYGTSNDGLIAIEHQSNTVPQVALIDGRLGEEAFRKRLWNATMSGAYPVMTGAVAPDSANGKTMAGWFAFMSERIRHWDIEPYFDVEGGRSIAIPGIQNDDYDISAAEYLVYIEDPQKVSVTVRKHSYDVYWVNPSTGAFTKEKKDWKGDLYEGTPPDATRDWILHLSRDGHKESMLKGGFISNVVKFESWPVPVQEPERSAQKAPFELVQPTMNDTLTVGEPIKFAIQLKRKTGGTRRMSYLITGEVVRDGQGTRVLATSQDGTFTIEPGVLTGGPGVMNVRVAALNAPGKLYILDYVFNVKGKR
jgi:hypothetical protein